MDIKPKKKFLENHPRLRKFIDNEISDAMSLRVKMCWIVAIMWVVLQVALLKVVGMLLHKAITDVEMTKQIFAIMKDFYGWANVVFLVWILIYMLGRQNVQFKVLGLIELNISNNPVKDNLTGASDTELNPNMIIKEHTIVPSGNTRTGE